VEGQSVALEYRYADDHPDRLAGPALDLVRRRVAVIVVNNLVQKRCEAERVLLRERAII
jgi:hypothetical protein